MPEVVTFAPVGRQPGLVAYECPKCAYVTKRLGVKRDEPPDGSVTEGTRRCRLSPQNPTSAR
jgi:hypothetical protein